MLRGNPSVRFLLVLASAAAFVVLSSRALPDTVASHFVGSGVANGFMPRRFYLWFMLLFVVALPAALVFLPTIGLRNSRARINLPNREYWLAAERRPETIQWVRRHMANVGSLLVLFLAYVHWLVLRANTVLPPTLPMRWFIAGLAVFLLAVIVWAVAFVRHFRNGPR